MAPDESNESQNEIHDEGLNNKWINTALVVALLAIAIGVVLYMVTVW